MIADAGALGTPSAPYTAEVGARPDQNVARALGASGASDAWLSFWTVSGPVSGDTWLNAGTLAGQTAAQTLDLYGARPSFVILDPEGYNGDPGAVAATPSNPLGIAGAPVGSANVEGP